MTHNATTRRGFIKKSTALAATGAALPYFPWSAPAFANTAPSDRPKIGCIGVGSMGMGDAVGHNKFGDIVAVCDVDTMRTEAAKYHKEVGKGKADMYCDYRKVLDRKDIDVVSIVTPDHWHVKIAVEALAAGKHVFCQKPLTYTVDENQIIRNACNRYSKQVFIVGTQQRSDDRFFLRAINMIHKGLLGDLKQLTVGINGGEVKGPFVKKDPPPNFNWDKWLGPAPMTDYIPERSHYTFRWWYEYSGGKFTDWGAHHIDIAQWAMKTDKEGTGPVEIDGTDAKHPVPFKDGFPTEHDRFNTAHDFAVKCKYPSGVEMTVSSRSENGILFEGEKGRIFACRHKITGTPIDENWDKDQFGPAERTALYKGKPFEGHKDNFYRCIREGGLPVSDVFSHVMTMNTCHLSSIAARLGRVIKWDPTTEKIIDDEQANMLTARQSRAGYEVLRVC